MDEYDSSNNLRVVATIFLGGGKHPIKVLRKSRKVLRGPKKRLKTDVGYKKDLEKHPIVPKNAYFCSNIMDLKSG